MLHSCFKRASGIVHCNVFVGQNIEGNKALAIRPMGFNVSLAFAQIHWPMAPATCLPYRIQKGTRHLLPPYGFQHFAGLCSNSLKTAPTMYLPYRIQKGIKHSLPLYGFQHFAGLCSNSLAYGPYNVSAAQNTEGNKALAALLWV